MMSAKSNRRFSRRLKLEKLEDRCLLAAGMLDPTFDGDGAVVDGWDGINEDGQAIAVYTDATSPHFGKLVSASFGYSGDGDLVLRRLNQDGSVDASFDEDGVTGMQDFGSPADALIQLDGAIVVGGTGHYQGSTAKRGYFQLARYNVDGSLDTGFGNAGVIQTEIIGRGFTYGVDSIVSLQRLADGRLLTVGNGSTGSDGGVTTDEHGISMARYNADGSLDTSFGSGGTASTLSSVLPGSPRLRVAHAELIPGGNGAFYVGGTTWPQGASSDRTDNDLFVAKYQADGTLDTTFGQDGVTQIQRDRTLSANPTMGMTVLLDGGVQLAYDAIVGTYLHPLWDVEVDDVRLTLARLRADGSADPTFGTQGIVTGELKTEVYNYRASNVTVQSDGSILVGGLAGIAEAESVASHVMVSRHLADGNFDPAFGQNGLATPDLAGYVLEQPARDLAIQPDGNIVLATSSWLATETWRDPKLAILRIQNELGSQPHEVTAAVVDGKLQITGDETNNGLRLRLQAENQVLVEGLDGTLINGVPQVGFSLGDVASVNVSMGAGHDTVTTIVEGGASFGGLHMETGRGKDFVEFQSSPTGRVMVIDINTGVFLVRQ